MTKMKNIVQEMYVNEIEDVSYQNIKFTTSKRMHTNTKGTITFVIPF